MSETPSGAPIPPNQPVTVPGPMPYAPQPPTQAPQPKKSRGPLIAVIIVAACLLFFGGCVAACSAMFGSLSNMSGGRVSSPFDNNVGVVHLQGTIGEGANVPETFSSILEEAEDDSSIKALVIRVDSGGGVASDGEEMAKFLQEFNKPVVISSGALNASAAYEISSQADYIYCNRSTEVGSIGTAMQTLDYSGLMDMLGIKSTNITSSSSKDSSYGTRPLTEDEIAYYQKIVDEINEAFIETVAAGREMDKEEVRKLATGLVFTGQQGVDNGLVDEIGTYRDALKKAAELGGLSENNYGVVQLDYETDFSYLMSLLGEQQTKQQLLDMLQDEIDASGEPAPVNQ